MTRQQADDTWWLGVAVAAFAVIAGQTVMVLGEAPAHAAWAQFLAITLAAATFPLMSLAAERAMRWPLVTLAAAVAAILLTLMLKSDPAGVGGWSRPPAGLHLGYIVTPLAIAVAAHRPGPWAAAGLAALSLALALQPDAPALIALTAALGALLALRRNGWTAAALAAAAFAAAWALNHPIGPISWVEAMPETALQIELWLGFLVALGLCLMPMPFAFVAFQGRRRRALAGALAAYWIGLIGASLTGAFPTPLVGYGVGAILGYVLSWALLRIGEPVVSPPHR